MPVDPFERNDRRDKMTRGISTGANVVWSGGLAIVGAILIILGAAGVGGAFPIFLGIIAVAVATYNLFRPFRL
jgi:hypothetical protein